MRKVLLSEDVSDDIIQSYIDKGFKPYFLSKRKIRRKDKKVWNKVRRHHLDPAVHVVFNQQGDWDEINISGDPVLDKLSHIGEPLSKYEVLRSVEVSNMKEAQDAQSLIDDVHLKFITVKTLYTYELRDELKNEKTIIEGTRDFCRHMVSLNKAWTLTEIESISTDHLIDMGLPADVFTYRGGFWRKKGTDTTFPACRHIFKAKIVIER